VAGGVRKVFGQPVFFEQGAAFLVDGGAAGSGFDHAELFLLHSQNYFVNFLQSFIWFAQEKSARQIGAVTVTARAHIDVNYFVVADFLFAGRTVKTRRALAGTNNRGERQFCAVLFAHTVAVPLMVPGCAGRLSCVTVTVTSELFTLLLAVQLFIAAT
jgi:hypothetical protein